MSAFHVSEQLLRLAVRAPRLGSRGDDDLNPRLRVAPVHLRPAAVLCAIAPRPDGMRVILTMRPASMREHAGQIAFPGGKVDADDPTPLAAALRETHEEIGLSPDQVEVLGAIEPYATRTGFSITPFVGLVAPGFVPVPEPGEVEAIFEAPLDFLMDPANCRHMTRVWQGTTRAFWAIPWENWFIWGATAGMLKSLADRVAAVRAAEAAES
jgi:8-oxo-dGTP pyrophosphatase MutT (NUDIX family)